VAAIPNAAAKNGAAEATSIGKNAKGSDEIMKQIQELQTKAIEIERAKNDEINSLLSEAHPMTLLQHKLTPHT
jgi:hypothetical protein